MITIHSLIPESESASSPSIFLKLKASNENCIIGTLLCILFCDPSVFSASLFIVSCLSFLPSFIMIFLMIFLLDVFMSLR